MQFIHYGTEHGKYSSHSKNFCKCGVTLKSHLNIKTGLSTCAYTIKNNNYRLDGAIYTVIGPIQC